MGPEHSRQVMGSLKEFTKPLTQFLSTLKNRLPPELVERTKLLFLDYLGAYCAGLSTKPYQALGPASKQETLLNFAFRYGMAAHALEMDDAHRYACVHPGSVVFSAALALSGALASSGEDFITAVAVGYEAICRVAYGLNLKEHYGRGFHPTGTCGPFGAAATAAKLLRLNPRQWESAFGIAGSMGAGSMQFLMDGTWTKPFHSGWAAHNGIQAALLAKNGFKGPSRILEGPYGFWKSHGEAENKSEVLRNLGKRYELMRTTIKRYPCCGHTQSSISALVELIQEASLTPENVKEIEIHLSGLAMPSVAEPEIVKRNPKTSADAMWSIYYGAAFTLLKGDLTLEAYESKFLRSGKVRGLIDKIRVTPDPSLDRLFPEKWPSIITVTPITGGKITKRVDHPRGDPENFPSWKELAEKFVPLSNRLLSERGKKLVIEEVKNLERVRDVRMVLKHFRPSELR